LDCGCDLQSVAHDPGVAKQPLHIARAIAGDLLCAESIERLPIVLPFLQNRDPTQSRLGAFENQELEEHPIVVQRDAPFFIVIGDGRFGGSPRTALHAPTMHDRTSS
jgi:hypothetical protein